MHVTSPLPSPLSPLPSFSLSRTSGSGQSLGAKFNGRPFSTLHFSLASQRCECALILIRCVFTLLLKCVYMADCVDAATVEFQSAILRRDAEKKAAINLTGANIFNLYAFRIKLSRKQCESFNPNMRMSIYFHIYRFKNNSLLWNLIYISLLLFFSNLSRITIIIMTISRKNHRIKTQSGFETIRIKYIFSSFCSIILKFMLRLAIKFIWILYVFLQHFTLLIITTISENVITVKMR